MKTKKQREIEYQKRLKYLDFRSKLLKFIMDNMEYRSDKDYIIRNKNKHKIKFQDIYFSYRGLALHHKDLVKKIVKKDGKFVLPYIERQRLEILDKPNKEMVIHLY